MTCYPSMIALLHLVANYIRRNTKLQKRNEQEGNITTLEVVVCIYIYRAYVINKSTLNSWPDDINLVEPKIRDQAVLSTGINETRVRMRLDQRSPFPRSTLIKIGKKFGKYPLVN